MKTASLTSTGYAKRKILLEKYYEWFMRRPTSRPESHPLRSLEETEKESMSLAKRGLQHAMQDIAEDTLRWPAETVAQIDQLLLNEGACKLSDIRREYSRHYIKVLKRGAIRTLDEYYLIKGIVDGGGIEPGAGELERLMTMLVSFENDNPPE